eukprot:TRINITY_DN76654_c0_g1_i1.p1 TRINITY_DN76654_c0_g1~~TRINITY_DN76654_c0_g1_i1.p1  ORF type:complete len:343 (-),score=87.24 TRINITY_DN76654_c0_g1_i1:147-1175(-)
MAPTEKGKKADAPKDKKAAKSEAKPAEKTAAAKAPVVKPAEEKKASNSGKGKKAAEDNEAESRLSQLRPSRRLFFFVAFVSFCAWLLVNFDPCKVTDRKKKQDCGWEGISPLNCVTSACFQKSQKLEKKTIKVKRSKGEKLGLDVADGADDKWLTVQSIGDGAVKAYNDALPADSEERILPGDSIWRVSGDKGKKMRKLVTTPASSDSTINIEIGRSALPSWLLFLHNPGELNLIEKALTSKGFERWGRSFGMLGGAGFSCWFFSGYPVTSLPMYMFVSSLTAWQTTRCCHDEKVPAGQPHCFFGGAKLESVVKKAAVKTREFALKVKDDPKSYVNWLIYGK